MTFGIFFALLGLPIFILTIAGVCYVHTGKKETQLPQINANDQQIDTK